MTFIMFRIELHHFLRKSIKSYLYKIGKMEPNLNLSDQLLRLFAGFIAIALIVFGSFNGISIVFLSGSALILFVTSAVKFCPLYRLLGVKTSRQ